MTAHLRPASRRLIATSAARLALAGVLTVGAVSCTSGSASPPDGGTVSTPTTSAVLEGAPVTRAPAIDIGSTGDFGGGVTAKITQITPIQATASLPGDLEGPAIAVTIEIDNSASTAIGLTGVTVGVTDSAGASAPMSSGNAAEPFAGMLVEGGKATGTYVFTVPPETRNPVTITVGYSPSSPTLVFAGEVAAG